MTTALAPTKLTSQKLYGAFPGYSLSLGSVGGRIVLLEEPVTEVRVGVEGVGVANPLLRRSLRRPPDLLQIGGVG